MNLRRIEKPKYKIFSNARGNIIKRSVETYIREDIPCKSQICEYCDPTFSKLNGSYYVIPNYSTLKHFYKILEQFSLIICETLLCKCEKRRLYFHLKDLIRSTEHQVVIFGNEHADMEVEHPDEGLISEFETALWYARHLEEYGIMIIYLDEERKKMVDKDGNLPPMNLMQMTIQQFVSFQRNQFKDGEEYERYVEKFKTLEEKVHSKEEERQWKNFLSPEEIESGIREHRIVKGIFRVNRHHSRYAFVLLDEETLHSSDEIEKIINDRNRININERIHRNRAVNGDEVYIQITLPSTKWKKEGQPEGEVVGIIKRNWRSRGYVVTLPDERNSSKGANVLTVPLDRRIPKIRIKKGNRDRLRNSRLLVRIVEWEINSRYPNGQYLSTIGRIGDIEVETKSLLIEHDLEWEPFSKLAINELPEPSFEIPIEERKKRRDFTDVFTCSIDPIGCTDIDDAISIQYIKKENRPPVIEIGVHIADVSYFVKPGTNLDREARHRSTSVYLVDRKHHMLPPVLSAGLCSLKMDEERLSVSVVWTIDPKDPNDFKIVDTWFGRSIIRSNYAFHYDQVEHMIKFNENPPERVIRRYPNGGSWEACEVEGGPEKIDEVRKYLIDIRDFARSVRKRRLTIGGLELDSLDEIRFTLDNKDSKPVEIHVHDDEAESHETIAELMILANSAVAENVVKTYDERISVESMMNKALLRIHKAPKEDLLREVKKMAGLKGHQIQTTSNVKFRKSLEKAIDLNDRYYNILLKAMATRSMNEALYCLAGEVINMISKKKEEHVDKKPFYHYGLGLEYYTHFTSPIRRYSDLVVHRQIVDCISSSSSSSPETKDEEKEDKEENMMITKEMCEYMNQIKRSSRLLQQDSSRWYQALFFKQYEGLILEGIIHQVTEKYIKVFIPNYRVNEVVFLTDRDKRLIYPILEERKALDDQQQRSPQFEETGIEEEDPFLKYEEEEEAESESESESDDDEIKSPSSIVTSQGKKQQLQQQMNSQQMMVWNDDFFDLVHDEKELSVTLTIKEFQVDDEDESSTTTTSPDSPRKKKRRRKRKRKRKYMKDRIVKFQVFDRVLVSIRVPEVKAHHPKIRLRLYSFDTLSPENENKNQKKEGEDQFGEEISKDEYRDILKQAMRRKREEEKRERMNQLKISKLLKPYAQKKNFFHEVDELLNTKKNSEEEEEEEDEGEVEEVKEDRLEISEILKTRLMCQLNRIKYWLFKFGGEKKKKDEAEVLERLKLEVEQKIEEIVKKNRNN